MVPFLIWQLASMTGSAPTSERRRNADEYPILGYLHKPFVIEKPDAQSAAGDKLAPIQRRSDHLFISRVPTTVGHSCAIPSTVISSAHRQELGLCELA